MLTNVNNWPHNIGFTRYNDMLNKIIISHPFWPDIVLSGRQPCSGCTTLRQPGDGWTSLLLCRAWNHAKHFFSFTLIIGHAFGLIRFYCIHIPRWWGRKILSKVRAARNRIFPIQNTNNWLINNKLLMLNGSFSANTFFAFLQQTKI